MKIRYKKKICLAILFIVTCLLLGTNIYAAGVDPRNVASSPAGGGLKINESNVTLPQFIANVLVKYGLPIVGAIAVGFVVWGGVQIILSSGEPEKLAKAKKTLLYSVIGIIIVVFAYYIVVQFSGLFDKLF